MQEHLCTHSSSPAVLPLYTQPHAQVPSRSPSTDGRMGGQGGPAGPAAGAGARGRSGPLPPPQPPTAFSLAVRGQQLQLLLCYGAKALETGVGSGGSVNPSCDTGEVGGGTGARAQGHQALQPLNGPTTPPSQTPPGLVLSCTNLRLACDARGAALTHAQANVHSLEVYEQLPAPAWPAASGRACGGGARHWGARCSCADDLACLPSLLPQVRVSWGWGRRERVLDVAEGVVPVRSCGKLVRGRHGSITLHSSIP